MRASLTLAIYAFCLGSHLALAQVTTWSSSSSGDWNTAGNWSGGSAPGTSNTANFSSSAGLQTTVDLSSASTVKILSFASGAPSYTLTGQTLTIDLNSSTSASGIVNSSSNTQTLNGSYILKNSAGTEFQFSLAAGNLVFGSSSNLTLTGVTTSTPTAGGNLVINGALTMTSSTINWNASSGILYYNPTSQSLTGSSLRSAGAGAIYLQKSLTTAGSLVIGNTGATSGNVYLNATGISVDVPITMNASTSGKGAGTYVLGMNASGTSSATVTGKITLQTATGNTSTDRFDISANNTLTVSGQITGTGAGISLEKTGSGTLILAGTTANTYDTSAGFTVKDGILALNKTAGITALNGNITVNSGATLRLDAHNQIADASNLILAGGTYAVNGKSETQGTLALTANSSINLVDLMGGVSSIHFANSSGQSWGSYTLTIYGTVGNGSIYFGSDASGLTSAQLSQIYFADYGVTGAAIDATGLLSVAAVPEPSAYALLGIGALIISLRTLTRRAQTAS